MIVRHARHGLVYADPAWPFDDALGARGSDAHYERQTMEDLYRLPVPRVTARDAELAIWVVASHLPQGIEVIRAWGFEYTTILFVWDKATSRGNDHFGMGRRTRQQTEVCLGGVRGNGLQRRSASVRQKIRAPVGRHSEKPHEARLRLEALYGDVSRLEMNARAHFPGWHAWGFDVGHAPQDLSSVLAPPVAT